MVEIDSLAQVAGLFRMYRDTLFPPSSALYTAIAAGLADDEATIQRLQPVIGQRILGIALLAAVHDLILEGIEHPLADYYLSRTPTPKPPDDAVYDHFLDFFDRHYDAIIWRIQHRLVQTNEIRRAANLMPAFAMIAERTQQPLAMIEIGPSAGLLMLWDHLRYDYGGDGVVGPHDAPLTLHCESRGGAVPLPTTWPTVKARMGIDLNPLDTRTPADARWLQALIWPEQAERRARLQAALALLEAHPPHMVQGDVVDELPSALDAMPDDATLVVYHSYAMVQLPPTVRESVYDHMRAMATQREVYHVALEIYRGNETPQLWLHHYHAGAETSTQLANCEPHGAWIKWLVL